MARHCPICEMVVKKRYDYCSNCGYLFTKKITLEKEEVFGKNIKEEFDKNKELLIREEFNNKTEIKTDKSKININDNLIKFITFLIIIGGLFTVVAIMLILNIFY